MVMTPEQKQELENIKRAGTAFTRVKKTLGIWQALKSKGLVSIGTWSIDPPLHTCNLTEKGKQETR